MWASHGRPSAPIRRAVTPTRDTFRPLADNRYFTVLPFDYCKQGVLSLQPSGTVVKVHSAGPVSIFTAKQTRVILICKSRLSVHPTLFNTEDEWSELRSRRGTFSCKSEELSTHRSHGRLSPTKFASVGKGNRIFIWLYIFPVCFFNYHLQ